MAYHGKSEKYSHRDSVAVFQFIDNSLGEKKFSFADNRITTSHNFLFVALQNFELRFSTKIQIWSKSFCLRVFWLAYFGFGFLE